jgi:hypothetical protein
VLHHGLGQLGIDLKGLNLLQGSGSSSNSSSSSTYEAVQQDGALESRNGSSTGAAHQGQLMQALEQVQSQQQLQGREGLFGGSQPLAMSSSNSNSPARSSNRGAGANGAEQQALQAK